MENNTNRTNCVECAMDDIDIIQKQYIRAYSRVCPPLFGGLSDYGASLFLLMVLPGMCTPPFTPYYHFRVF